MVRRAAVRSLLVIVMMLGVVPGAYAQGEGEVAAPNEKGVPPNRDYLALLPFEVIDTASNNLILRFTDLTLPGNAGRSVRIERVFSNSTFGVGWRMGIAGVPMRVVEPPTRWLTSSDFNVVPWDLQYERRRTPSFQTLEGGAIRTTYWAQPTDQQPSQYLVRTSDFGQYNRDTRILLQPDGTSARYCAPTDPLEPGCPGEGYLKELSDPYGNTVTLAWEATGSEGTPGYVTARLASLTQDLGNGQTREVTFGPSPDPRMPGSMTYLDRTWQYGFVDGELRTVTPPVGPAWRFEYSTLPDLSQGKVTKVTTPQGGWVRYEWADRSYPVVAPGALILGTPVPFNVLVKRVTNDLEQGDQTWLLEPLGLETSPYTLVTRPDGTELLYFYQPADPNTVLEGAWLLQRVEVRANGITVEADEREYAYFQAARTPASNALWGLSQPIRRTIRRMGTTHTTEYAYGSVGAHFHNYHHPTTITERGPDGTVRRTTTRTYTHLAAMPSTPYLLGLPASEAITEAGVTTSSSRTHVIATGFRETETVDGVTTTFTPDARGNVATVTKANGKAMEMTYQWGVVKDVTTQAGVNTTRTINPDGAVESETIANRPTAYHYDALSRRTESQPPGDTVPITTTYDNTTGKSWTTSRGSAFLTTTTDGFGRPIETRNSLDVRTRLRYDGEGRKTYQSYPFKTTEVGTEFGYDALGRITLERNTGDDTSKTRTYDDVTNAVTVQDEEGRETVLTYRGYGHPDDARLVTVVDAADQTWTYTYDVRGNLAQVVTPTGHTRTWTRNNTSGLLESETHPESGTTYYTNYDAAGVLKRKVDAKGTEFNYEHDGNDRLTRITTGTRVTNIAYEAGSDNRTVTGDGTVTTTITYETTTGRPHSRQDAIGPYVYTTTYGYDATDNVTSITYPTGRIVNYDVDNEHEHEITHVYESAAGRDYAAAMTYHPSGGLQTYTASNGISTTIGYHPQRYWVESITSGALQLTYGNYDGVGNVGSIGDSRAGMGQTFMYDSLDRLSSSTSTGYPSTTYAYDAHGNQQTVPGTTYTYDTATLRLQQQNTSTFGYDDNGNLTSVTGTPSATYTYTPENWLSTATASGVTTSYAYDADGWRARKSTSTQTTLYFRGLNGELLTEWQNPGPSGHVRDYVYAGSRLLAAVDKNLATSPATCGGNGIPDGSPHAVAIATAGATGTYAFEGTACRRVSIKVSVTSGAFGCAWLIKLMHPDGTTTVGTAYSCGGTIGFLDATTLPVSGWYTVVVDPAGTSTGSADVYVYDVVDRTENISPGGAAVPIQVITPGQNARLTFNGVMGQRVSALGTSASITGHIDFGCDVWVRILKPDGNPLSVFPTCMEGGGFLDVSALPSPGAYTVLVDPATIAMGNLTVTLYDVPADPTGSITPNGAAVPLTITTPGQNAAYTFSGTAGQRVSLNGTNATITGSLEFGCDVWVRIKRSNGTDVTGSLTCMEGGAFMDPVSLPANDTYTISVDPTSSAVGSLTLTLYAVPADVTGSVTVNGTGLPISLTGPGQQAQVTFAGTNGQQVTIRMTGNTIGWTTVKLLNPNNVAIAITTWNSTSFNLGPQTLSATGTYTVVVDPNGTAPGDITVAVTNP